MTLARGRGLRRESSKREKNRLMPITPSVELHLLFGAMKEKKEKKRSPAGELTGFGPMSEIPLGGRLGIRNLAEVRA
jgi:hypothetical protein